RVFALLEQLLTNLSDGQTVHIDVWLRVFEARLLTLLGYRPLLDRCAICHRPATEPGALSPRMGGYVCSTCEPGVSDARRLAPATWRVLARLTTLPWEAANRLSLSAEQRQDLQRVLHALLNEHVRKEVKSYRFLS